MVPCILGKEHCWHMKRVYIQPCWTGRHQCDSLACMLFSRAWLLVSAFIRKLRLQLVETTAVKGFFRLVSVKMLVDTASGFQSGIFMLSHQRKAICTNSTHFLNRIKVILRRFASIQSWGTKKATLWAWLRVFESMEHKPNISNSIYIGRRILY